MAYCRDLDEQCSQEGCVQRATVEVRNNRNEPVRRCCRRHGDALAARLTAEGS